MSLTIDRQKKVAFLSVSNLNTTVDRSVNELLQGQWTQQTDQNCHLGLKYILSALNQNFLIQQFGVQARLKIYPRHNFLIRFFVRW